MLCSTSMFSSVKHAQAVKYTIIVVGTILLCNSVFYFLADLLGSFKPFLASTDFKPQIGYFTAIFIHKSNYHLLVNLSMITIAIAFLRKNASFTFITLLVIACGSGALIVYSYIGDMIGYSGTAFGSSGISFGLLANSTLVYLDRFTLEKLFLTSIVPFCFVLFECIRIIGLKSEFFVATSPMSNVAHIAAIIIGYCLVVLYMLVTNTDYVGVILNFSSKLH